MVEAVMKRITLLVLLFSFSFVFAVMSEDLGELAKKEKARRDALDKSGKKAKVFTNDDIDKLKSEIAMESKSAEGEAESAPADEATYTQDESTYTQEEYTYNPPVEGEEYVPTPEPPQEQPDPLAERNKKIRDLEEQKEELEQKAKDARDNVGAGGLWHSRNTGDQYRTAREAEQKQEKLDQQIESTRTGQPQQQQVETPPPPAEEYVPPQEQLPPEEPAATEEEPPF
jgi:hypothetical protein